MIIFTKKGVFMSFLTLNEINSLQKGDKIRIHCKYNNKKVMEQKNFTLNMIKSKFRFEESFEDACVLSNSPAKLTILTNHNEKKIYKKTEFYPSGQMGIDSAYHRVFEKI